MPTIDNMNNPATGKRRPTRPADSNGNGSFWMRFSLIFIATVTAISFTVLTSAIFLNVNAMRSEIASLRSDMNGIRSDMNSIRSDMNASLNSIRSDMNANQNATNIRFDDIQHQLTQLGTNTTRYQIQLDQHLANHP